MKFSENANYLEYISAFADNRYELAGESLEKCLNDVERTFEKSFLLSQLGEIAFLQGYVDRSIGYFESAVEADSMSLQPRYIFAEFLARKLGRLDEAINRCDQIILSAEENPFEESDEEFSSDYYIAKANELRDWCVRERNSD